MIWISSVSATSTVIDVHLRHEHTVNTVIPDILKNVYRLIPVSSQPLHIWMSILSLFKERSGHFWSLLARERLSPPLLLYLTLDWKAGGGIREGEACLLMEGSWKTDTCLMKTLSLLLKGTLFYQLAQLTTSSAYRANRSKKLAVRAHVLATTPCLSFHNDWA